MTLIPPTHGRAGVRSINSRKYLAAVGEDAVRRGMVANLNRHFRDEFGVDAPEAWLSWETVETPDEVDIRLSAEAPTRAREALALGEVRAFQIPVSTESRVPIVPNPYAYGIDTPFRRDDHVLTFAGWDAETGLMVFDR